MKTDAQKFYDHMWYLKNRERLIEKAKAWNAAHPENFKINRTRWWDKQGRTQHAAYMREYRK